MGKRSVGYEIDPGLFDPRLNSRSPCAMLLALKKHVLKASRSMLVQSYKHGTWVLFLSSIRVAAVDYCRQDMAVVGGDYGDVGWAAGLYRTVEVGEAEFARGVG